MPRMHRAVASLALVLAAPRAMGQDVDEAVRQCLQLGATSSAPARAVLDGWLPPRPNRLTLSAGFAVGPEGAPHGSASLRTEVTAGAPFYLEAQARALLGSRLWISAELFVGANVSTQRGTRWRGTSREHRAPWSEAMPSDPPAVERWMHARSRDCGVSQGAWRVLGGARLFSPMDGLDAGPSLQVALALGASRSTSSYADGDRTGLDLALFALLDPTRLQPGVLGRVSASWGRLVFGLDGAWVFGPAGYAFVTLDVGVQLLR